MALNPHSLISCSVPRISCLDFLSGRAQFSRISSWIPVPGEASVWSLITGDPTSWSPAWGPAGPCYEPLPHLPMMALGRKALSSAAGLCPDLQTGRSRVSLVLFLCGPIMSLSLTPRPFLQAGPLALLSDQSSSSLVLPTSTWLQPSPSLPACGPQGSSVCLLHFCPLQSGFNTAARVVLTKPDYVSSLCPPSQHQGLCAGCSLCLACFSLGYAKNSSFRSLLTCHLLRAAQPDLPV